MRYAILSDLHANAQAWAAVRADLQSQRIDAIICLGDIVGYGPDPVAVLADARATCQHFVIGNHDAAAAGLIDSSVFSHDAHRIIEWTARQIADADKAWFAEVPYVIEAGDLVFVHAETPDPAEFGYVEDPDDAQACFAASPGRLIWFGHTHVPGVFALRPDGSTIQQATQDFLCAKGTRYLINVGSVGDPRDGRVVSSYCIYDDETDAVYFRSVPFDLDAFRARLASTGLGFTPWFLREETRRAARVRGEQDMKAAKVASLRVRKTGKRTRIVIKPVAPLTTASAPASRRKPSRSRTPYVIAGLALALLGGSLFKLWWSERHEWGAAVTDMTALEPETAISPAPRDPWLNQDVGQVVLPGGVTYANGTIAMTASGADIWEKADAFHFMQRPRTGDGSIAVLVESVEAVNPWSKAGVMIRESLAPGSRHAIVVVTPSNHVAMQYRLQKDAISAYATGTVARAPWWVKLERQGDQLTGYDSVDGTNWVQVNRIDLPGLAGEVHWGLCLTSHETARVCRAVFDHLRVDGKPVAIPVKNQLRVGGGQRTPVFRKPGLVGSYFADAGYTRRVGQRVDSHLAFTWNAKPPFPGQTNATWSVRWQGIFCPTKSGSYQLSFTADDYGDVRLDGVSLFKGTGSQKAMNLAAGRDYELQVDYRQDGGKSAFYLNWSTGRSRPGMIPAGMFWHYPEHNSCYEAGFANSMEYWRAGADIADLQQKEGSLTGTWSGPDPHLVRMFGERDGAIELRGFGTFFLRMQHDQPAGLAAVAFATDKVPLSDATRVVFPLQSGGTNMAVYRVDLSQHPLWKGQLRALRLDPVDPPAGSSARGTFRIDELAIGEAPAYAN